jgi:hypothetical protein
MSTSGLLIICAGLYLVAIFADGVRSRSFKRFVLELLPLVGLIAIDLFISNATRGYIAFGAVASSIMMILIMLVCILLGIAARYIFYLHGEFYWLDFAKPFCISPLLLIPLVGSVQAVKELEMIQVISFALLAFQNGFFWQTVLQKSKPKE